MSEEIKIREVGSFFEVDSDGYIINPASKYKISKEWQSIIDEVISGYLSKYGENLHSVYVRGSVAKGEAIIGISDLDTFSYVNLKEEDINRDWFVTFEEELLVKYPFVKGIEFGVDPVSTANNYRLFILQSACVYGEDLSNSLPKIKIGKDILGHVYSFHKNLEYFDKWVDERHSSEEIRDKCTWLMKRILRTALELVVEDSKLYTRDLYPSYKIFSKYYPEKETEMKEVLYFAINPTGDSLKIKEIRNNIGNWIDEKACKFKK